MLKHPKCIHVYYNFQLILFECNIVLYNNKTRRSDCVTDNVLVSSRGTNSTTVTLVWKQKEGTVTLCFPSGILPPASFLHDLTSVVPMLWSSEKNQITQVINLGQVLEFAYIPAAAEQKWPNKNKCPSPKTDQVLYFYSFNIIQCGSEVNILASQRNIDKQLVVL